MVFTPYTSKKNFAKLTVIQTTIVPHNPVQISCTPQCLFYGFVFFLEHEMVVPEPRLQKKSQAFSNVCICELNIWNIARQTFSKVDISKNGMQKEF